MAGACTGAWPAGRPLTGMRRGGRGGGAGGGGTGEGVQGRGRRGSRRGWCSHGAWPAGRPRARAWSVGAGPAGRWCGGVAGGAVGALRCARRRGAGVVAVPVARVSRLGGGCCR